VRRRLQISWGTGRRATAAGAISFLDYNPFPSLYVGLPSVQAIDAASKPWPQRRLQQLSEGGAVGWGLQDVPRSGGADDVRGDQDHGGGGEVDTADRLV
jgi:hypothetical protein